MAWHLFSRELSGRPIKDKANKSSAVAVITALFTLQSFDSGFWTSYPIISKSTQTCLKFFQKYRLLLLNILFIQCVSLNHVRQYLDSCTVGQTIQKQQIYLKTK